MCTVLQAEMLEILQECLARGYAAVRSYSRAVINAESSFIFARVRMVQDLVLSYRRLTRPSIPLLGLYPACSISSFVARNILNNWARES